jgi:hypothetical protein
VTASLIDQQMVTIRPHSGALLAPPKRGMLVSPPDASRALETIHSICAAGRIAIRHASELPPLTASRDPICPATVPRERTRVREDSTAANGSSARPTRGLRLSHPDRGSLSVSAETGPGTHQCRGAVPLVSRVCDELPPECQGSTCPAPLRSRRERAREGTGLTPPASRPCAARQKRWLHTRYGS